MMYVSKRFPAPTDYCTGERFETDIYIGHISTCMTSLD